MGANGGKGGDGRLPREVEEVMGGVEVRGEGYCRGRDGGGRGRIGGAEMFAVKLRRMVRLPWDSDDDDDDDDDDVGEEEEKVQLTLANKFRVQQQIRRTF